MSEGFTVIEPSPEFLAAQENKDKALAKLRSIELPVEEQPEGD